MNRYEDGQGRLSKEDHSRHFVVMVMNRLGYNILPCGMSRAAAGGRGANEGDLNEGKLRW
jgi:hypothetical protein